MKLFSAFIHTISGKASASELEAELQAAKADRQALRAREQALAVERQDAVLAGAGEDLDRIEAELVAIHRAAERHDLRIPELRRLHGARRMSEQHKADKLAGRTGPA
ncbi:hypothetical protein [Methylobacterium sp. J-090]|uniref:hypothetical protein n=1 Tax=Methylobacterium sp. J-090 TaxID=2836666 RepID=UPI001FBA7AA6|nr:hypothetical protein [Methylobacterium sp. J-090]MCJ2084327.1 hypothetical protein [Methylobacterium sp. J-090]